MTVLRGVLTADHPAAGVEDRCSPCCAANAAGAEPFFVCPDCGLWLLRCPSCRGALAPSGWCERCLDLRLQWPTRIDLAAGGSCDVPLELTLASAANVTLHHLWLRCGANEKRVDLRDAVLQVGGRKSVRTLLDFPSHGEFSMHCQVEVSWPWGARLPVGVHAPGFVRVRPPGHGHVVNISGTGNLVAGGSGAGIFGLGDDAAPRGVGSDRSTAPLAPEEFESKAYVSWRSRLLVPDLLEGGPTIELVQRVGAGVALGRNRPNPAAEPVAGPNEAALRFPPHFERARESSQALSRSHWRLHAHAGEWAIEQLGQRPTTVCTPGVPNVILAQGQRAQLLVGSALVVPAEPGGRMLRFVLRHREVVGGHVLRSELALDAGAHR